MKKHLKFLYIVACLSWLSSTHASNFNYNYLQFGYINSNIDIKGTDIDGDSFFIGGSFAVNNRVNALAQYQTGNYDFNLDTDLFGFGFGFHTPLSSNADAIFNARLLDAQVKSKFLGRGDDTGYSGEAKLRYASNPYVELNAGIEVINLYDDTESMFGVGTLIKFDNERSVVINYSKGDTTRDITLGFRMEF